VSAIQSVGTNFDHSRRDHDYPGRYARRRRAHRDRGGAACNEAGIGTAVRVHSPVPPLVHTIATAKACPKFGQRISKDAIVATGNIVCADGGSRHSRSGTLFIFSASADIVERRNEGTAGARAKTGAP
jgi:hypothetical protein